MIEVRTPLNALGLFGAAFVSACSAAILAAWIHHVFEFELVSFSWSELPFGALFFGWLATTGLSIAYIQLRVRASAPLRLLAPFIGMAAFALTYFFQFWLIRNAIPGWSFADYLKAVFTREDIVIGAWRWEVNLGPAAEFGYFRAGFRLLAVAVGSWAGFRSLTDRPWCASCARYLRSAGEPSESYFLNEEHFRERRRRTAVLASDASAMAEHLGMHPLDRIDAEGIHYVRGSLFACPGCGRQVLREELEVYRDGKWHPLFDETNMLALPKGHDFSALFTPVGAPCVEAD